MLTTASDEDATKAITTQSDQNGLIEESDAYDITTIGERSSFDFSDEQDLFNEILAI